MPASLPTAPAPKRRTTSPPGSSASPAGRTPASRRRRSSSTPAAALSPCTSPSITRRPLAMPTRSFRAVASAWPIAWRGATWRASAAFPTFRPPPPTPRWAPPHDRRSPDRGRPRLPRHPLPSPGPPARYRPGLRRPAGGGAARRRPGAAGPYRLRPPAPWRRAGGHARRPAAAAARAAPRSAPRRHPAHEHGARAAAPRPAYRRQHPSRLGGRRPGGGASSRQPLAPAHRARVSARGAVPMSTAGQGVGGIVGAIAGALIGGPTGALYGAQIGMTVGGLLDPPKGPSQHGPSPYQVRLTTSTYGANIPRVYGTCPAAGNVVWLEGDRYRVKKSKSTWKLYTGTDTQQPDPRYQADKGVNAASGWPGLAYIVFYDLPLEKWQNTLAGVQIKAEIVTNGTSEYAPIDTLSHQPVYAAGDVNRYGTCPYWTTEGGYYFEPQWISAAHIMPYSVKVWLVRPDFSRVLYGILSTGVESGFVTPVKGKMDIVAQPVAFDTTGSLDYHVGIVTKAGELHTYYVGNATEFGIEQPVVRKLGNRVVYATSSSAAPLMLFDYATGARLAVSATAPGKVRDLDIYAGYVFALDETGAVLIYDMAVMGLTSSIPAPGGYGSSSFASIAVQSESDIIVTQGTGGTWRWNGSAWAEVSGISSGHEQKSNVFAIGETLVMVAGGVMSLHGPVLTPNPQSLDEIVKSECLQANLLTTADLDVSALADDTVRGFRVSDTGPIRASLEPLSMIWPMDCRMHGYTLQFVRRGGASVASVPAADLDARMEEADPGPLLTLPRDMDTQLPQKVVLGFLDVDREYDRGEQEAARYNTDARNIAEPEVAVVLNAQEGKRASEVLLYNYWRERGADITFSLPPAYLHLEPADVVTVTAPDGASHVLRLTNVNTTPAGIQECTARRDQPGGYTSSAVAETGAHTGAGLIVYGPTLDALLDIPALTADGNSPGFYAAACGVMPTWPGALLYASYSDGQDWEDVATWDADFFIGTVATSLGAPTCFNRVDAAGTLTVSPYAGTLASVTEAQMLAGANHFAYGAHGRWEILAARTVTLNGDATYTLQDFLRGRRGFPS